MAEFGGKVPESEAWSDDDDDDDDDDVGLNVLGCRVDQGLECGFGAYLCGSDSHRENLHQWLLTTSRVILFHGPTRKVA